MSWKEDVPRSLCHIGYCVFQAALGYVNTEQSGSEHARADQQCIVNEHFAKQ